MVDSVPLGTPLWRVVAGLLVVLALAISLMASFFAYNMVRAVDMGFSFMGMIAGAAIAMLFSWSMLAAPIVLWMAFHAWMNARVRRRILLGRCVSCNYHRSGIGDGRCPECGREVDAEAWSRHREAPGWLVLAIGIWTTIVIGCVAAEGAVQWDEHRFRKEAATWEANGGAGVFLRSRCWPNGDAAMIYERGRGFQGTD